MSGPTSACQRGSWSRVAFYAFYCIGGALLTGATWFAARRAGVSKLVRPLTGVSFFASLAILAMTIRAAPLMWRVGSSSDDPELLRSLLDRFTFWTDLRIVCADVSFVAILFAILVLAARASAPRPRSRASRPSTPSRLP
jgi:hypothetical protein